MNLPNSQEMDNEGLGLATIVVILCAIVLLFAGISITRWLDPPQGKTTSTTTTVETTIAPPDEGDGANGHGGSRSGDDTVDSPEELNDANEGELVCHPGDKPVINHNNIEVCVPDVAVVGESATTIVNGGAAP